MDLNAFYLRHKPYINFFAFLLPFLISWRGCVVAERALEISLRDASAHLVISPKEDVKEFFQPEQNKNQILMKLQIPIKNIGNATARILSESQSFDISLNGKVLKSNLYEQKSSEIYIPPDEIRLVEFSRPLNMVNEEAARQYLNAINTSQFPVGLKLVIKYQDINSKNEYGISTQVILDSKSIKIKSYKELKRWFFFWVDQ